LSVGRGTENLKYTKYKLPNGLTFI